MPAPGRKTIMSVVDLHIHSLYSDSDQSVEAIFDAASRKKLTAFAITDHDTTAALSEADTISAGYNIELIPGIELTAEYQNSEIHVLGYFFDRDDHSFCTAVEEVRDIRRERLIKMAEKVNSLGGRVDIDHLVEQLNVSIATRLHLAQYMLETNQVNSIWEAFKKYLSPGSPAYVNRSRFSVKDAIRLIRDAGGYAVLAHPHFISDTGWIKQFADLGLNGLEVIYPRFSPEKISFYTKMADDYGLFKTGGSDAHGSYKDFTGVGQVVAPYSWVEEMKHAKGSVFSKENI